MKDRVKMFFENKLEDVTLKQVQGDYSQKVDDRWVLFAA